MQYTEAKPENVDQIFHCVPENEICVAVGGIMLGGIHRRDYANCE